MRSARGELGPGPLRRVAGIDVDMHGTFLILPAWVGVSHYLQRHHLADAGAGVVFILALFAIIGGDFLSKLLWVNALAVFNLTPAFSDGRRADSARRAAMRMDDV